MIIFCMVKSLSMSICRDSSFSALFAKMVNPLLCVAIITALLYWGQEILKPLTFSCLFALLLISPCNFFERQGFPRGMAALVTMLLALMLFIVIFYSISSSIISFRSDLPRMIQNINDLVQRLESNLQQKFHLSPQKMQEIVNSSTSGILPKTSAIINTTVNTVTSLFFVGIIIFITTFLLLFYRSLVVQFFVSFFADQFTDRIHGVLSKIRFVIKSYIFGLFIEMLVVAAAYSVALLVIGVQYAFLLGVIGAILNLIPYLGIFMALILSSLVTLSTDQPQKVIWVIIAILAIHMTDSNILMPRIVGGKVRLNALVTILGVTTGSALWGIPGMFLAVPIMAILKVIFEEVQPLQSFALIMGDDTTQEHKTVLKRIANRVSRRKRTKK